MLLPYSHDKSWTLVQLRERERERSTDKHRGLIVIVACIQGFMCNIVIVSCVGWRGVGYSVRLI